MNAPSLSCRFDMAQFPCWLLLRIDGKSAGQRHQHRQEEFCNLNRAGRIIPCHCEPTGRRIAPPDDRLREAIHASADREKDCFVASAPRNGDYAGLDRKRNSFYLGPFSHLREAPNYRHSRQEVIPPSTDEAGKPIKTADLSAGKTDIGGGEVGRRIRASHYSSSSASMGVRWLRHVGALIFLVGAIAF